MSVNWIRWRKKLLIALLVLVGLYVAYRGVLWALIAAQHRDLRASGQPITIEDLNEYYEDVPPTRENAAPLYTEAESQLAPDYDARAVEEHLNRANAALQRREAVADETAEFLADTLDRNRQALQMVHQAAGMRWCRHTVDFSVAMVERFQEQGIPNYTEHRSRLTRLVDLLRAETVNALLHGEAKSAMVSLRAMLAVAKTLEPVPLLDSQTARGVFLMWASAHLESALNTVEPSEKELARLAAAFAEADTTAGWTAAVIGRRCVANAFFRLVRQRGAVPLQGEAWRSEEGELSGRGEEFRAPFGYVTSGLWHLDYLCFLRHMRQAESEYNHPLRRIQAWRLLGRTPWEPPQAYKVSPLYAGAQHDPVVPGAFIQHVLAAVRLAQAAIAVERHRIANGTLPDRLDDTAPAFLTATPNDPSTGCPLRYRREGDRYRVFMMSDTLLTDDFVVRVSR